VASTIKVDQIQSDTGTVNLASNLAFSSAFSMSGPVTLNSPTIATPTMTGQAVIPSINLTSGQIVFPATQNPSAGANTLDDYEEGTWTPAFSDASSVTYTQQTGRYVKVGRTVTVQGVIRWSSFTAGGNLRLGGVPFTPSSEGAYINTLAILGSNGTAYNQAYQFETGGIFFFYTNSGSPGGTASSNPYGSSGYINISGTYFTTT